MFTSSSIFGLVCRDRIPGAAQITPTDSGVTITIDMPGASDLKVFVERPNDSPRMVVEYSNRDCGSLRRTVGLDTDTDTASGVASYVDGVLTVTFATKSPQRIPIEIKR